MRRVGVVTVALAGVLSGTLGGWLTPLAADAASPPSPSPTGGLPLPSLHPSASPTPTASHTSPTASPSPTRTAAAAAPPPSSAPPPPPVAPVVTSAPPSPSPSPSAAVAVASSTPPASPADTPAADAGGVSTGLDPLTRYLLIGVCAALALGAAGGAGLYATRPGKGRRSGDGRA